METKRYNIVLHSPQDRENFVEELQNNNISIISIYEALDRFLTVDVTEEQATEIKHNPAVQVVEEDRRCSIASSQPLNPPYNWGLDRIDQRTLPLSRKFNYTKTGSDVNVFILDSGINFDHYEFSGRAALLIDTIEGDPAATELDDGFFKDGRDAHGHGTHVAAIAGGSTFGVAKNSKIWSVKVLNANGIGFVSNILAGISATIAYHTISSIPGVANMSLSFSGISTAVDSAVVDMVTAGIVVCVAAGNHGKDANNYSPARVQEAITVGAVTQTDSRAYFSNVSLSGEDDPIVAPGEVPTISNIGSAVDVFAPGHNITSAYPKTTFQETLLYDTDDGRYSLGVAGELPKIYQVSIIVQEAFTGSPRIKVGTENNPTEILDLDIADLNARRTITLLLTTVYPPDTEFFVTYTQGGTTSGLVTLSIHVESDFSNKAFNGTSMASPHAAGVCALYLQGKTKLTSALEVAEVHDFITENSTKNILSNIPDGTPNRLLYSYYVDGNFITWTTPAGEILAEEEDTVFSVFVEAEYTDPFGEEGTLTYSSSDLPSWATLNSITGEISGTTPTLISTASFPFTVIAEASTGTLSSRNFSILVEAIPNQPPVWDTPAGSVGTVVEGSSVSIQLLAHDPDPGDSLTFSLLNPSIFPIDGLTVDSAGLISGIADGGALVDETHTFTMRVSDGDKVADRTFSITLQAINFAPVWAPTVISEPVSLGSMNKGSSFSHDFQPASPTPSHQRASDPDGDPITFAVSSGSLPNGLTLSSSGVLSGTVIGTAGTYIFKILVSDSVLSAEREFSLEVIDVVSNLPPVWVTPTGSLGSIDEGQPSTFVVQAIDPEAATVTYSLNLLGGESFPVGLTLNSNGSITGVASDVALTTTHTFTVRAEDDMANTADRQFSITVNNVTGELEPVWITPEGSLGEMYEFYPSSFSVLAEDPEGEILSYSIIDGQLPTGLVIDPLSGDIMGIAAEVPGDTVFEFTVEVTDGVFSVTRDFSITVLDYHTERSTTIKIPVTGESKEGINEIVRSIFCTVECSQRLFRIDDPNFGVVTQPTVYLVGGLQLNPTGVVGEDYEDQFIDELDEHHFKTTILLGDVKYAVARDLAGEIKYEVLYSEITDPQAGADYIVDYPQENETDHTQGLSEITPPSLENMRQQILTEYDLVDDKELLPEWMSCEQVQGDSSSVLGWTPSLVLAYLKPGLGQLVLDLRITPEIQSNISGFPIIVDRYNMIGSLILVPNTTFYDISSGSTTFDDELVVPTFFDLNTTTFFDAAIIDEVTFDDGETVLDVEFEPFLNKYIKFPPGDILGIRPAR